MLVLSRKKGEAVRINDDIIVAIVDIRGDKVRIGIEAAKQIPIDREEIYQAKLRSREAGQPVPVPTP